MDGLGIKIPSFRQILTTAVLIAIIMTLVRMFAPEPIKQVFRA